MDFIPSSDVTSPEVGDLIGALIKIRDPTENLKVKLKYIIYFSICIRG